MRNRRDPGLSADRCGVRKIVPECGREVTGPEGCGTVKQATETRMVTGFSGRRSGLAHPLRPYPGQTAAAQVIPQPPLVSPKRPQRPEEQTMLSTFTKFWNDESGQGLTEYALILALVSIGLIAVMVVFRDAIGGIFDRIAQVLEGAPNEGYTPGS